jgi:D-alanyl-D-alanine carboxypeptidase (penicillin-binding protein 5/6)
MKRIVSLMIAVLFAVSAFCFFPAAHTGAETFDPNSVYEPYYILSNAETPTVSYRGLEREADKQVYPASTTKILTCIVALENGNPDDMVTVSANAVNFGRGNSLMGLEEGDQFSLRDLLYGMMLPSGNDAAIAIAEHIAGSTEAYAEKMNEKAAQIGMTHSHFVTVHGKQNDNHYTTVRDMALLTAYALNKSPKSEEFRKIVKTGIYTTTSGPREIRLVNSNRMIVDTPATETLPNPISCLYADAIGIKTGDTAKAGKCLIAAAERDGVTLIAVLYGGTIGDPEYNDGWNDAQKDRYNVKRFNDAAALFDYAYADMVHTVRFGDLVEKGLENTFEITIPNASAEDSQGGVLKAYTDISMDQMISVMQPDPNAKVTDLKIDANYLFTVQYAPIGEGSVVGSVAYVYNGKTLASGNLIAERSVKEGTAQTDITPVGNDSSGNNSSPITGNLIGDANAPSLNPDDVKPIAESGGCGLPENMRWVPIVLAIVFVLLIVCVVLFILYLRAEAKRRRAAARRRARQRARESGQYTDRR